MNRAGAGDYNLWEVCVSMLVAKKDFQQLATNWYRSKEFINLSALGFLLQY